MNHTDWPSNFGPDWALEELETRGLSDERKLRLLACTCCRRLERWLTDLRSRAAVVAVERFAEGSISRRELNEAGAAAWEAAREADRRADGQEDADGSLWAVSAVAWLAWELVHLKVHRGDRRQDRRPAGAMSAAEAARIGGPDVSNFLAELAETAGTIAYHQGGGELTASNAATEAEERFQCDLIRDIFGNPFRPVPADPPWRTSEITALARRVYDERDFAALPILADALQDARCDNEDVLSHCRSPGPHVRGCWVVDLVLNLAPQPRPPKTIPAPVLTGLHASVASTLAEVFPRLFSARPASVERVPLDAEDLSFLTARRKQLRSASVCAILLAVLLLGGAAWMGWAEGSGLAVIPGLLGFAAACVGSVLAATVNQDLREPAKEIVRGTIRGHRKDRQYSSCYLQIDDVEVFVPDDVYARFKDGQLVRLERTVGSKLLLKIDAVQEQAPAPAPVPAAPQPAPQPEPPPERPRRDGFVIIHSTHKGSTRPDYSVEHDGFTEWVNQKYDHIDQGHDRHGVYLAGIDAARIYLRSARVEAANLPREDRYSLDFVADPGPETRQAMLRILFCGGSPVHRVKFGESWYDRETGA